MSTKTRSAAVVGLDAVPVDVEADIAQGLPKFTIVGLPDAAVQESRERVRAALKNSGLPFPHTKLTVNLAPADIKKQGPAYDLPIAVAILRADGALKPEERPRRMFLGELALDGSLRPVAGTLPVALMAAARGYEELYVPSANAGEASFASGISVFPVDDLPQLFRHLAIEPTIVPAEKGRLPSTNEAGPGEFDLAFVKGQLQAKRALEIAAAGGHNLLLSGPPGSGKTILARALGTILPAMTGEETLEVTRIYSVAGLTAADAPIVTKRPFRAPHHTASGAALIGGGSWPKPGEVTLAHRGVLFLDEFPEFNRDVLENLRQPLEDGTITVSRANGTLKFPAKFMLVAARNPCPCGYASDQDAVCVCSPARVANYGRKISGPLLDRIDLCIEVPKLSVKEVFAEGVAEASAAVRERVQRARDAQQRRLSAEGAFTNAEMTRSMLRRHCALEGAADAFLRSAAERLRLSARAVTRVLKVARTVADLDGSDGITEAHVAETLHFRERAAVRGVAV